MAKKEPDSQPGAFDVQVWLTRPDRSALCAKQPGYLPVDFAIRDRATIRVNPARRHQMIDGFGFALTGGSADLITQLAPTTRDALLRELFMTDRDGIGLTHLRISIGASDLSSATFSYDDLPAKETDPGLHRFNLGAGDAALFPY
jgi:glucosylceramidase